MKQNLHLVFTFLLMAAFTASNAQTTIYSQDFEGGLGDMISIDNDGLTVNSQLTLPSEWSAIPLNPENSVAVSPSWFATPASADDWLITPPIAIEGGAVLEWSAASFNGNFPESYNVMISTTDTELSSFSQLLFVSNEEGFFNSRLVDLIDYEGMTVHIAFQNITNDGVALAVDDITVRTTNPIDARISGVGLSNTSFVGAGLDIFTGLAGEKAATFEIFNAGRDNIETIEVTYTLDGVEYVDTKATNVWLGDTYTYVSDTAHDYVQGDNQAYSIDKVVINGEDQSVSESSLVSILPPVPAYEAVDSKGETVNIHTLLDSGKTVVLDFFASWCGPCQTSEPMLEAWYQQNGAGDGDMEVLGIDIEEDDTDAVVNNLGWGGSYPKISYKAQNELYWVHFTQNHGLNEGFIPFFLMICPNPNDASNSELNSNLIGVPQTGSFSFWQLNHEDCIARFVDVEDIEKLESVSVFPNPTSGEVTIDLEFGEVTDFEIAITTVQGKQVKDLGNFSSSEFNMNADIHDVVPGVYILQITTAQGQRNHRFVKI